MRLRHLSITIIAFSLAACGTAEDVVEAPEAASGEAAAAADIVVEGPERRILAFGDSLFAGYGLEEQQGYPEQLEDALRERGTNARVIDAGVS
ncbi:MAG: arylesterase, partial [Erythrobacter sp.]